jgi:hypothetical protein
MGDSQYRFSKIHRQSDNITDVLYIKIKSSTMASTFVINSLIRVQNMIRLYGEIAELSELGPQ